MSGLKLIIAGTIASISLVTAVALPSPDRASRPPAARVIPFGPSTRELMDDQWMLVRDMRKLRRELKRGRVRHRSPHIETKSGAIGSTS
jgi:hypothetical protein